MSYLVLHFDMEFIVGTVCADNGSSYPINNGNEDLLWLYFFNNPHQNRISFGKDNKAPFENNEINYYGKFFNIIENEQLTFTLRGIPHPMIDLLDCSELLETAKNVYHEKTHNITDSIPTLLTFSMSIGDNAKQKTVDYLRKKGFEIKSYTIPLAELTCFHSEVSLPNGSTAVFLEATNPTLHLMKMLVSDQYYLVDGSPSSFRGKGVDPRKQALVRYVVNEANKSTGILSNEDEINDECERFISKADEWLNRLDAQTRNMPLRIYPISFLKAPRMMREAFVRSNNIDGDTGYYTQVLKDILEAFMNDNSIENTAEIFLLGDCFNNERIKTSLEQITDRRHIHFFKNRDIQQILSVYPKIDINRYSSEEALIKARAENEQLIRAHEREAEERKRKDAAREEKRKEEERKNEENRKMAERLFEIALEKEKEGQLQDAKINVENALMRYDNEKYKKFLIDLEEKIKRLKEKDESYKSFVNKAETFFKSGNYDGALEEYEAASEIFSNATIYKKISDLKRLIKKREEQKKRIAELLVDAKLSMQKQDIRKAKAIIDELLTIDDSNAEAKEMLPGIELLIKKEEQLQQQKAIEEQCLKLVGQADELYGKEQWQEAKLKLEEALKLSPKNKDVQSKIHQCEAQIKAQEDAFNDLLMQATVSEKKGQLKEALDILEKALAIRHDNSDVKGRIKRIKFNMDFEVENDNKRAVTKEVKNKIDFQANKPKVSLDDDFDLKKPRKIDDDDFDLKKPKKSFLDDDDDFLMPKKK
ncbi:MAG: hypothetical protein LBR84_04510 [Tannerella sp.]|jgi:tetratricopeptide (TPR) repeat protein|nr:hypothetical protein [Tannerella sp.]